MSEQINPHLEIYEKEKVKTDFKKFDQTFRVRSFYEKYRMLAKACNLVSWFFNLLSIASGVLGVASLLAAFIYPDLFVMAVPALLVLVLSELTKRFLLRTWIIEKYRDKKTNYGLVIANLVLITGSGFATVYGGIEAVNLARGKAKPTLVSIASIKQDYKTQITAVNLKIKALTDRNTYRGKTWLPSSERKLNTKFESDIRQLKADRKQAIAKANKSNDQILTAYRSGTNKYIVAFIILSVIIEVLCIVTVVFPIFYQHKSRQTKADTIEALTPTLLHPEQWAVLLRRLGVDAGNLLQQINPAPIAMPIAQTPIQQPAPAPEQTIGFRQGVTTPNTPKSQPTQTKRKERGTSANYKLINQLLLTTTLTTHQIAVKAECSDTTVRNARKKLKEQGLLA